MKFLTLSLSLAFSLLTMPAAAKEVCTPIEGGGHICEMEIENEAVQVPEPKPAVVSKISPDTTPNIEPKTIKPRIKPSLKTSKKPTNKVDVAKANNNKEKVTVKEEKVAKEEQSAAKAKPKLETETPIEKALKKAGLMPGSCFSNSDQIAKFVSDAWGIADSKGVQWEANGKELKKGFREKAFFSFYGSPVKMDIVSGGQSYPKLDTEVCIPQNILTTKSPKLHASIKGPTIFFVSTGTYKVSIEPHSNGTVSIADIGENSSGLGGTFRRSNIEAQKQYLAEFKEEFAQK